MEKPRAEDTAVEDRSILIKSGSAQNVCTSYFCRHEKILQSVSFPRNGKSFLHCQQLPLLNIARNLKCLPEDYSMILSYFIPPDVSCLWGRMDYCQHSCSKDNLNAGLRTHRAAQPSNAPVSGWSQLANICRLPNERSIYIYCRGFWMKYQHQSCWHPNPFCCPTWQQVEYQCHLSSKSYW